MGTETKDDYKSESSSFEQRINRSNNSCDTIGFNITYCISLGMNCIGLASLAFTQNWFNDAYSRGSFIILMGSSTLIMRGIIVCCARRCQEKDRYLALIFIAIASYSDCIFDLIQGFVLISGYKYSTSTNIIVIVGTWIGFTDELLEFIEEIIANCCQICKEECCSRAFRIWLFGGIN